MPGGGLCQASWPRSTASYIHFTGEMGQSQQKTIIQCDKVSRKLFKQCHTKGHHTGYHKCTIDGAHGDLGADNSCLFGGKVGFPWGFKVLVPAQDQTLPMSSAENTESTFPFYFHQDLWGSLGLVGLLTGKWTKIEKIAWVRYPVQKDKCCMFSLIVLSCGLSSKS